MSLTFRRYLGRVLSDLLTGYWLVVLYMTYRTPRQWLQTDRGRGGAEWNHYRHDGLLAGSGRCLPLNKNIKDVKAGLARAMFMSRLDYNVHIRMDWLTGTVRSSSHSQEATAPCHATTLTIQ